MAKVAVYVDGFNLYHAIDTLANPRLKWLDLMTLANSFVREADSLVVVRYFSALQLWDKQKSQRHKRYLDALYAVGVLPTLSVFRTSNKFCHGQSRWCDFREEKQTDVALAVTALTDAMDHVADRVVFITADSDHVPLIQAIRSRFPGMHLILAAPPGRLGTARELGRSFHEVTQLTEGRLNACLLPRDVYNAAGKKKASCPAEYLQ